MRYFLGFFTPVRRYRGRRKSGNFIICFRRENIIFIDTTMTATEWETAAAWPDGSTKGIILQNGMAEKV